jgi:hypothetical protein
VRNLALSVPFQTMTQGGIIDGQHVDPFLFPLTYLAHNFRPSGEVSLVPESEMMQFQRSPKEMIDGMISRFLVQRYQVSQGIAGPTISWRDTLGFF